MPFQCCRSVGRSNRLICPPPLCDEMKCDSIPPPHPIRTILVRRTIYRLWCERNLNKAKAVLLSELKLIVGLNWNGFMDIGKLGNDPIFILSVACYCLFLHLHTHDAYTQKWWCGEIAFHLNDRKSSRNFIYISLMIFTSRTLVVCDFCAYGIHPTKPGWIKKKYVGLRFTMEFQIGSHVACVGQKSDTNTQNFDLHVKASMPANR